MDEQPAEKALTAVEMLAIWKRFPEVVAVKGVDLELHTGEVHALLGENGAGKTTLMNVLAGAYRPDSGTIRIAGRQLRFASPNEAIMAGIGMVHQHFHLVEKLTVAENIHLGWGNAPALLSPAELARRTEKICSEFGLQVEPSARIWQLSTGEQQRVEILRVLARGARILVLDEPTAVLTPAEADELFRVVREWSNAGRTVVFISHKLDEVVAVSDRITVLRGGVKIGTLRAADCDQSSLARMMVGQDLVPRPHERSRSGERTVLELRHAWALNDRGMNALKDVTFSIREGEILGVAGVAGNGQSELAEVLTGLRRLQQGFIIIDGNDHTSSSPSALTTAGVGHIPEDRVQMGLVQDLSVRHNAILRSYRYPPIARGWRLSDREADHFARQLVSEAGVKVPTIFSTARHLSGGNQQKLVARREMQIASRLLIAVHPTRGLDIAATEEVHRRLVEHRNSGSAVLLISEHLDEVLLLADRVLVMCGHEVVGEFDAATCDRTQIGLLMGGAAKSTRGGP